MSHVPRYVGTAERETLFRLLRREGRQWCRNDKALYDSKEFTQALLQRLAERGMVSVRESGAETVYTVTRKGSAWALEQQIAG